MVLPFGYTTGASFLSYYVTLLLLFSSTFSSNVVANEEEVRISREEQVITVAGGCFWSIELAFQRIPGVLSTEVGYVRSANDDETSNYHNSKAVTYGMVSGGNTGYAEAVRITFDTNFVRTKELYDLFLELHDPTTVNRQGGDIGTQYRSAIFYHNEDQSQIAKDSIARRQEKNDNGKRVVTEVSLVGKWHTAEEYHQQYLLKGGQDATKSSLTPIQCYGNRGPMKNLQKLLSIDSMSVLLGKERNIESSEL